MSDAPRVLLVDLNNFAYYPTLSVGYLVALLRADGFAVEVLSPLAHGVPSLPRERVETRRDHLERRLSYSTRPAIVRATRVLGRLRSSFRARAFERVLRAARDALSGRPDALLVSTYTDSREVVRELGRQAAAAGIPMLVGGPAFNEPRVAAAWTDLPGVAAIVGVEVEPCLCELVRAAIAGEDLARFPGTTLPDGRSGPPSLPLRSLDRLPLPDFDDFPWDAYPRRVVPVMTGRGCAWSACTFCADVVTVNGRTYRSRTAESVLDELETQARRYDTQLFTFLDIKLNSNVELWRALARELPRRVPGARWIATVHVAAEGDNGLSRDDLAAARAAGLVRVTFGMESASQHLLDAMDKGTTVEGNARFIEDAHAAGLSVRTTVFQGYPGEDAGDLERTADFLHEHRDTLDRVKVNRLAVLPGTRFHRDYERDPTRYPGFSDLAFDWPWARSTYAYAPSAKPSYRRAMRRFLGAVHAVNTKPLREHARAFDGLM